jgi:hypothetical protein
MDETTSTLPTTGRSNGLATRIRAELKIIADRAGQKTSMPIVVPGAEITEAMLRVFEGTPKVPDFDAATAETTSYGSVVKYASDEIPTDPVQLRVFVDETGDHEGDPAVVLAIGDVDGIQAIPIDPETAESLFLAGLAACAYAKPRSRYAAPVD